MRERRILPRLSAKSQEVKTASVEPSVESMLVMMEVKEGQGQGTLVVEADKVKARDSKVILVVRDSEDRVKAVVVSLDTTATMIQYARSSGMVLGVSSCITSRK